MEKKPVMCPSCQGMGRYKHVECVRCGGNGFVWRDEDDSNSGQ